MRTIIALLFVAAAAVAEDAAPPKPDPAAEDLVKKLEAKVAGAKTVSLKLTEDVTSGGKTLSYNVEVAFKEGNRARQSVSTKGGSGPSVVLKSFTCDGKRLLRVEGSEHHVVEAAADLAARGRALAVRGSIAELTWTLSGRTPALGSGSSGFAFLADEKVGDRKARVVSYQTVMGSSTLRIKVWIDAEKLELLKRETVENLTTGEVRVTDTFGETKLDGELKDEDFEIKEPEQQTK